MKTTVNFSGSNDVDIKIPNEIIGNPLKIADYLYKSDLSLPENTDTLFDINVKDILSDNILNKGYFDNIQEKFKDALYLKTKYDLSGKEFYRNDYDIYRDWNSYIIIYTNQEELHQYMLNYISTHNDDIISKDSNEFIIKFYQSEIKRLKLNKTNNIKSKLNKIYKYQPDTFGFDIDDIGLYDIVQTIFIYLYKNLDQKIINKFLDTSVYEILKSLNNYTHELIDPDTKDVLMTIVTLTTVT